MCNLLQHNDNEHEITRHMKTQFFIEMESFSGGNVQVLVIGNCCAIRSISFLFSFISLTVSFVQ